jgi:YHS domain-containing protein
MSDLLEIRIPIFGLGCGGAGATTLEREFAGTPGVVFAYVNPVTETAYLRIDPATIEVERLSSLFGRALINEPALILADEPTANLDSKIGHEIMRLLRRIALEQGRSVVVVSHDERIRDIADRVLWLEDGAFKDIVTMATDPVCGMTVERKRAVSAELDGQRFSYCSRGCPTEFLDGVSDAIPLSEARWRRVMEVPGSGVVPGPVAGQSK